MPGSKQHFLPATYLACFSKDTTFPRRDRRLWQGDRTNGSCVETAAANLAKITNLYTLEQHASNPSAVDDIWFEYESRLSRCIDQLILGSITAVDWATVLVPFVTCLLVRGPDFEGRLNARLGEMGFDAEFLEGIPDNVNSARVMEIQRLLAPILVAEWVLIEFEPGEPLLTGDQPYVMIAPGSGFTIPIDPDHAIQLRPRTKGPIVITNGAQWYPLVSKVVVKATDRQSFNRAIDQNARRFVFGSDRLTIMTHLSKIERKPRMIEPGLIGFIYGRRALVHEFVWHRFVSALYTGITTEMRGWDFDFNFEALRMGWAPPITYPTNLPDFIPGLLRQGNSVLADLYEPPDPMPTISYEVSPWR